jgi:hypothetical protein
VGSCVWSVCGRRKAEGDGDGGGCDFRRKGHHESCLSPLKKASTIACKNIQKAEANTSIDTKISFSFS